MIKHFFTFLVAIFVSLNLIGQPIEFSTAGFFALEGSPRSVESMNPAWRFYKGSADGAYQTSFDDSQWQVVSLPHGLEDLPQEASGGKNYRGEAWYRKHFSIDANEYAGKRIVLYFEAVMGKSKVWLNGELVGEHYGGYLPIPIDITDKIELGQENVLAVLTDNSDDPIYPPGKPQGTLDFCYFGGIYRDVWLISTSQLHITDANMSGRVAGGGLLVHYTNVSANQATVNLELELANTTTKNSSGVVEFELEDGISKSVKYSVKSGQSKTLLTSITVDNPKLWSPENPHQYDMKIWVKDNKGTIVDGYRKKIGVRSIVMDHYKGVILNGEVFPRKLIGANRHQDFAIVGNALSNNLHWRDAQKLKDAGMEIIRNAHYPQDPAFMDACDALGLFVIVNTPGWQFWNDEPIFQERVYDDIRQMVRRDRNYSSVIMWEPILNETWYPDEFSSQVHDIVKQESPYSPNYTASDAEARGSEFLDISFTHPLTSNGIDSAHFELESDRVYFTREFGDNVDDWNSHNSPSRVAREWGEVPQLIQAKGYGNPDYQYTSIDELYRTKPYHIGGTLWHSFDHQRGYHPDPFYGGIMTAFRRPKYSYYMFQSQALWKEPMVYIANIMSPFSPGDVTVYSNCDQVRLYTRHGDTLRTYNREKRENLLDGNGMPSPIITFKDAFSVMSDKRLTRQRKHSESYLLAEGYIDGKLVATHKVMPTRRPSKINVLVDTLSAAPVADGGDLLVVVAQITDAAGNVKRLNNEWIKFAVEGEASLVGDSSIGANPTPVLWGEACAIIRTTTTSGKVKVKASVLLAGDHTPLEGEVVFTTLEPSHKMIYSKSEYAKSSVNTVAPNSGGKISQSERAKLQDALREVEQQQEEFGESR